MSSAVRSYFERQAAGYGRASERGLWAAQRRREAEAVKQLADVSAGESLLDLGCGAGYYATRFFEMGCDPVVAVDESARMLGQIQKAGIATVNDDVATVRLKRTFDRIVAAGVLEFVPSPPMVLSNIRRHMGAGGRAILLVPPDTVAGRLYRGFHRLHGLNIRLFRRHDLEVLAAAAQLRITASRRASAYSDVYALEPM